MTKKIHPNLYQYPGGTRAPDMPVVFNSERPRSESTPEEIAALGLFQYIAYAQQRGRRFPQSRTFKAAPLYGVFRGDVMVNWGAGRNARQWAQRAAGNCWDNELRAQYLGCF